MLERLGRAEEALADYGRAIQLDPQRAPGHHARCAGSSLVFPADTAVGALSLLAAPGTNGFCR